MSAPSAAVTDPSSGNDALSMLAGLTGGAGGGWAGKLSMLAKAWSALPACRTARAGYSLANAYALPLRRDTGASSFVGIRRRHIYCSDGCRNSGTLAQLAHKNGKTARAGAWAAPLLHLCDDNVAR